VATFGAAFVVIFTCTALVFASLLARRILRALDALSQKAKALTARRVLDAPSTPIAEFNAVIRVLRQAAEELVRRETDQKLLVDELNHRVKNTLATVQALARRSFRGSDPDTYATFEARLMALSDSHNLLTAANWNGVSVRALVGRELKAYGGRSAIDGFDMILPPKIALGLSMTVHELATNAAKHGALSTQAGRVSVRWKVDDGELVFVWEEHGGPPVAPPARRGFGSTLIRSTIEGDLGGRLDHHFGENGVTCAICIPLEANQAAYATEVA
jgi:two-component sensor histidine kinase